MAVTKRTETGQKEEEQKGLEKEEKKINQKKKNNNYHKKNKAIMIPEGFICNCQAGNL